MDNRATQIKLEIRRLEETVRVLSEDERAFQATVRKIDSDLSNTMDEFVATTGKSEEEFWSWRRRAKQARLFKYQAAVDRKNQRLACERELMDAQMLLYATESGYRGEDEAALLRALYHLSMEVLSETQYQVDDHQLGLIAAVRHRTEMPQGV